MCQETGESAFGGKGGPAVEWWGGTGCDEETGSGREHGRLGDRADGDVPSVGGYVRRAMGRCVETEGRGEGAWGGLGWGGRGLLDAKT